MIQSRINFVSRNRGIRVDVRGNAISSSRRLRGQHGCPESAVGRLIGEGSRSRLSPSEPVGWHT